MACFLCFFREQCETCVFLIHLMLHLILFVCVSTSGPSLAHPPTSLQSHLLQQLGGMRAQLADLRRASERHASESAAAQHRAITARADAQSARDEADASRDETRHAVARCEAMRAEVAEAAAAAQRMSKEAADAQSAVAARDSELYAFVNHWSSLYDIGRFGFARFLVVASFMTGRVVSYLISSISLFLYVCRPLILSFLYFTSSLCSHSLTPPTNRTVARCTRVSPPRTLVAPRSVRAWR